MKPTDRVASEGGGPVVDELAEPDAAEVAVSEGDPLAAGPPDAEALAPDELRGTESAENAVDDGELEDNELEGDELEDDELVG